MKLATTSTFKLRIILKVAPTDDQVLENNNVRMHLE
jgi:hypothetical protein